MSARELTAWVQKADVLPAVWQHLDRAVIDFTQAGHTICGHCYGPLNRHTWRVTTAHDVIDCSEAVTR